MKNIHPLKELSAALREKIETHYGIKTIERDIVLEDTPNPELGDIGMGCFFLSKNLKKSPASIAEELANLSFDLPYINTVRSVGPYLNMTFDAESLIRVLHTMVIGQAENYGTSDFGNGKQVMIEYSAPNSNKPQHLGHVRNNVLGMAVSNLLDASGYKTARVNLINDRGIHVCKSMMSYKKWGNGTTPGSENIKGDHFVGDFYVMFDKKAKDAPELLDEVREMLKLWENGDKEVVNLWKKMNDWVYKGFDETYDRLGCRFDRVYLESETYTKGKDIVLKGLKDGILSKNDTGEVVIDLDGLNLDAKVLLRSDGTSIYMTQDIGTTVEKFTDFKLDKAVWVVASEQNLHFKILFHVLERLGYTWADKCYHLNYGMVYLPEGKLKSREGRTIDADTLMDELHELSKKEIIKRSRDMDDDTIENTAEAIALSALKYFILKVHPQKDINFLPEESLSLEGSTGPFAQYSYARLSSILRKGEDLEQKDPDFNRLGNPEEKRIAVMLAQYPGVVIESAEAYNPSRLALWIFEFSRAINKFHHDHSVLNTGDPDLTKARIGLVRIARQALGNGLRLLGIKPLEKM